MSGRPKSNTGLISYIPVTVSGLALAAVCRAGQPPRGMAVLGKGKRFGLLRCGAGWSEGRKGPWEHQDTLLSKEPASGTGASVASGETLNKSINTGKTKTGLRHRLWLFRVTGPRTGLTEVQK